MPHLAKKTRLCQPIENDIQRLTESAGLDALHLAIPSRESWSDFYRDKALELGYVMRSGDVASAALAKSLAQAFGTDYLVTLRARFSSTATSSWPALLVRPDTAQNVSATRHVLMHAFLRLGVRASEQVLQSYRRPGKVPKNHSTADEQAIHRFKKLQEAWKRSFRRHTVREVLSELGLTQTFRHHRLEFPKLHAALRDFRGTDLAERQVGRRKRVYVSSTEVK
jgi:hypothetical protein